MAENRRREVVGGRPTRVERTRWKSGCSAHPLRWCPGCHACEARCRTHSGKDVASFFKTAERNLGRKV
jgi:hypothetical protein